MTSIEKMALAWYINNDDTNSGGINESGNKYWLRGKRAALRLFESYDEVDKLANEYDKLLNEGKIIPMTEQQDLDF